MNIKPIKQLNAVVVIPEEIKFDIQTIFGELSEEVGLELLVKKELVKRKSNDKEIPVIKYTVTGFFMIEQHVHGATVEKTEEAYASIVTRSDIPDITQYRGMIHKHPGSTKPSPSGQDNVQFAKTVDQVAKGSFFLDMIGVAGEINAPVYCQLVDKEEMVILENVEVEVKKDQLLTPKLKEEISKLIPEEYEASIILKRIKGTLTKEDAKEMIAKYVKKIVSSYSANSLLDWRNEGYYYEQENYTEWGNKKKDTPVLKKELGKTLATKMIETKKQFLKSIIGV